MKSAQTWTPLEIQRRTFDLTPQRPVLSLAYNYTQRQGARFDMHWELELGVVCSGTMHRESQDWNGNLHAGDVWLCGMWEPHGWRIVKAPCEARVLVILPQMLVNLRCDEAPGFNWLSPFSVPPAQRPRIPAADRAQLIALARRFADIQKMREPQRALWQRALLMQMLLLLHAHWQSPAPAGIADSYYGRVNAAIQLVFNHRARISAQQAAAACGISRNRFNDIFEEVMGISFARFALRYRLSHAAAALLHSDAPLKAIAAEWGFTDASHLHHCIERHYGCSPLEYRRRGQP